MPLRRTRAGTRADLGIVADELHAVAGVAGRAAEPALDDTDGRVRARAQGARGTHRMAGREARKWLECAASGDQVRADLAAVSAPWSHTCRSRHGGG